MLPVRLRLAERLLTEFELRSSLLLNEVTHPQRLFQNPLFTKIFPFACYGNAQIMRIKANNDLVCLPGGVAGGEPAKVTGVCGWKRQRWCA